MKQGRGDNCRFWWRPDSFVDSKSSSKILHHILSSFHPLDGITVLDRSLRTSVVSIVFVMPYSQATDRLIVHDRDGRPCGRHRLSLRKFVRVSSVTIDNLPHQPLQSVGRIVFDHRVSDVVITGDVRPDYSNHPVLWFTIVSLSRSQDIAHQQLVASRIIRVI